MSDIAQHPSPAITGERPPVTISAKTLGKWALAFGIFTSGFVIREPAPYEFVMVGLVGIWFLAGLKISRTVAPLLAILVLYNVGGLLSIMTMADIRDAPLYIAISLFLALTSVFLAAVIESNQNLLITIFRAYVLAACVTALLGIGGYLGIIPGGEIFTRYSRAMGVFQDPNVFGPYLVLPSMYLLHGIITGRLVDSPLRVLGLLILTLGVFLSFSRASWGLYTFSSLLLVFLLLMRERSSKFRLKILIMSISGFVLLIAAIVIALQFEQISSLFEIRAQVVQDYDGERLGRFARHAIGFVMAMEHPLGIGPMEFGHLLGEDEHNMMLKSLMAYGWLGFACYIALIASSFYYGFKYMLRERPWQRYFMLALILLLGHTFVGIVIDTDHWRHFYILIGIVWGCIALEKRYGASYN